MAATAELLKTEEYGRSLSMLRYLAETALDPHVTLEQKLNAEELAFADFETAVAEMLKTDKEFREWLDVDKQDIYPVINGQVCRQDGKPMVEILKNGADYSVASAAEEPAFKAQAQRDAADVVNAKRVDNLTPGKTIWGASLAPNQALAENPALYRDRFGYRKGLTYIQSYSMQADGTLVARSYSVDFSDEDIWREVLAEQGMNIPADASEHEWLNYSEEQELDSEQADQLIRTIRDAYYQRVGRGGERRSINDYVEARLQTVRTFFDAYYLPLSHAVHTETNNETIKGFAAAILGADIRQLKQAVKQELLQISSINSFNDEQAKLIDSLVRYAVAEELRKGLHGYLRQPQTQKAGRQSHLAKASPDLLWQTAAMQNLNTHFARNVRAGVQARRSYGGCPGNARFDQQMAELFKGLQLDDLLTNQQEAFGGKTREELSWHGGKIKVGTCVNCKKHTKVGVKDWCKQCIKC